ncbi:MAG: hypothetical protein WC595_05030 [Candidatus Nanoarchaeia archaeon]
MKNLEIERVFLVKELPKDIEQSRHIIIKVGDFFEPNTIDALKLKQKGDTYELVKKEGHSTLNRTEHTIKIKKKEFDILWKVTTQNHEKIRYYFPIGEHLCEIDCYKGRLDGYVRVEVEFSNKKKAHEFISPQWFGTEISDFNHDIHEDLGLVSFEEMKQRYLKRKISLHKMSI